MNHLTQDQISVLKKKLLDQKMRVTKMLARVQEESPVNDEDRLSDNASSDADATEEVRLIESEVMDSTLDESLARVTLALDRMEKGTYGLDANTGAPIPFARLEIDPTVDSTI
ncbi:MAG: hypothetical protein UX04_C0003G0070 [Microgenomates group bacterium GW2011_GWF2_45_18]|nr:MAG: hypothetical protein UW18_C0002G0070 [Microgenomates group bacterium GW2011_GWF1_44_10]KKU01798.1 MAG: hypothetical protein UX04_C0003G0070 [Microgenomates group bacterium GW2011_GWF2_45_18]OGJ41275.1 MAG: hypothetical protein A2378_04250 [Candidatus Pacebacteria bacterium RIFOXYB1_FULL_44_10]